MKAVTAVTDQALVSIEGKGMGGVYGIAARIFDALAEAQINVTMISQSSSEASITFALQSADVASAHQTLKSTLSSELSQGQIDDVVVKDCVSLVAAVGLGMAHQPGISGRGFFGNSGSECECACDCARGERTQYFCLLLPLPIRKRW